MACAPSKRGRTTDGSDEVMAVLRDSLQVIADSYPGEIGIALITDGGDTVLVNDTAKYALMSVFKVHQAVALCHRLETDDGSLDSTVNIARTGLDPDTWSPMLKDYAGDNISISLRQLLRYTLQQSDNNASNYLFEHLQPVDEVDSFIAGIIPRESFGLRYSEAQMSAEHKRAYDNRTSPLGAAIFINRLYTDDTLLGRDNLDFLRATLRDCKTGTDRIVAPLLAIDGVTVGHKTGSGYKIDGRLSAHNDIGFIRLPDGRSYTLAVFVKDFDGDESQASAAIARISSTVYNALIQFH